MTIYNINVERVSALPDPVAANTIYVVKADGETTAHLYFTNNDGTITATAVEEGPTGPLGGLGYEFSTSTTDSDPGSGIIRFNHATFASITQIYIDNEDGNANDVSGQIDTWDDVTNAVARGYLDIYKSDDATVYRKFKVTGAVTDGTGYRKVAVTPVSGGSNGTLDDVDRVAIQFRGSGADGSGAVDSVNGQSGAVVLNPDDLDDSSTTNKFITQSDVHRVIDNGHLTFSEPYSETIAASSPDTGVYLGRINVGSHILMLGATGSHAEEAITLHIQKDYNSASAGSFDHQCVISLMNGDLYQVLSFHAVTVSTTEADLFLVYDINDASVASNIIRWAAIGNPLNREGFTRPVGVTIPTLDATNDLVPMVKIRTSGISFSDDVNMSGATVLNADDIATANQFKNNTADKLLETTAVWSSAGEITLTDAATISLNMADFINAKVTLGGDRTLGNPFNTKAGQTGYIRVIQDATGNRTMPFGGNWKFPGGVTPALSTAANAVDMLFYTILPDGTALGSLVKDVQ